MDKSIVTRRLTEWAKWKMLSGNALGFPKASSFTHLVVDGSRQNLDAGEIDSWCMETDAAVMTLPKSEWFVIRVEYISNVRELGLKLELCGISKATYYRKLNAAYKTISIVIDSNRNKVDRRETIVV